MADSNEKDDSTATSKSAERKGRDPNRKRHGARNQHKMKDFVRWLLDTFAADVADGDGDYCVVDVAGGKGELAVRLAMCHGVRVIMVDPRPANVASVYLNTVVPKLPNKWQRRLQERIENNPMFVQDTLDERFEQLKMYLTEETIKETTALQRAIDDCSLLIGMHADSAVECIVDVSLRHNKPFVVVPCCVFPNLFQQRYLINDNGTKVPVRNHEEFCEYLLRKDSRFRKSILPFEGRNVAIWWDGKSGENN